MSAWTWILLLAIAGCGRVGFGSEDRVLAVDGTMVSAPGSLVIEDGRYDLATAVGGEGYAVAWAEYPPADRTVELRFATVSERGDLVGTSLVEILDGIPDFVRIWSGPSSYLLVYGSAAGDVVFLALDPSGATTARRVDTSYEYTHLEMLPIADGFTAAFTIGNITNIRLFDAQGVPSGAPRPIDTTGSPQTEAGIVATSNERTVVWIDERVTNEPRIRHARVDTSGQPVGASATLYDVGNPQGKVYVAGDGTGGFIAAWDGFDTFPEYVHRFASDGTPSWAAPLMLYDEPGHHDTVDLASSGDGRVGIAWITEVETLLTNVVFVAFDGNVANPVMPESILITNPRFSFCYPEVARGTGGFGIAFAGEVDGSLGLFVATVLD